MTAMEISDLCKLGMTLKGCSTKVIIDPEQAASTVKIIIYLRQWVFYIDVSLLHSVAFARYFYTHSNSSIVTLASQSPERSAISLHIRSPVCFRLCPPQLLLCENSNFQLYFYSRVCFMATLLVTTSWQNFQLCHVLICHVAIKGIRAVVRVIEPPL